jgi:hypothetical protein
MDEVSHGQTWDGVKWIGLTWANIQGAFDLYQKSVKKILKDKKTG